VIGTWASTVGAAYGTAAAPAGAGAGTGAASGGLFPPGWTPFIDPLNLHDHWWLTIIPLIVLVSIAYKAIRTKDLSTYWKQVAVMSVQVFAGMIALAVLTFLIVEVAIPVLE